MYKPTKSLLVAALISLAPAAYAQAQLTNGTPDPSDPMVFNGGIFNLPTDTLPASAVSGTGAFLDPLGDPSGSSLIQVNVGNTGVLVNDYAGQEVFSGEFNIDNGGTTDSQLHFFNSEVNVLDGGSLGQGVTIEAGSSLNVSAGATIGSNLNIEGTVSIAGGTIDSVLNSFENSTVTIDGGDFGNNFDIRGNITINGGDFSSSNDFFPTSNVTINGGDFGNNDDHAGVTVINGGNFGGNTSFEPGSVGTINGGDFNSSFDVEDGSTVTINAGDFGSGFDAEPGSTVVVNDGIFTNVFNPNPNSDVTINGGTFGSFFLNEGDTEISGGTFGAVFRSPGDVSFLGTGFAIDGVAISGGSVFAAEGSVLTGTLLDGNSIEFDLFTVDNQTALGTSQNDFFAGSVNAGGTNITIGAVPEPSSLSLLAFGALGLIARRKRS